MQLVKTLLEKYGSEYPLPEPTERRLKSGVVLYSSRWDLPPLKAALDLVAGARMAWTVWSKIDDPSDDGWRGMGVREKTQVVRDEKYEVPTISGIDFYGERGCPDYSPDFKAALDRLALLTK